MNRVYNLIWLLAPIAIAAALLGHRSGLLIVGVVAIVAGAAGLAGGYRASRTVRNHDQRSADLLPVR